MDNAFVLEILICANMNTHLCDSRQFDPLYQKSAEEIDEIYDGSFLSQLAVSRSIRIGIS